MERKTGDSSYFPLFDFLRIALAVGVFVAHAAPKNALPEDFGNACVQIFFALSGFLIGGILLTSTPASLPRFFFNRCTRIWVPYAVGIALLFAGTAIKQGLSDPKIWEFFFYKATFVYNFFGPQQLQAFGSRMPLHGTGNHFWSICVEEQFYLVAPFVIVFLKGLRLPVLVGLVALNFVHPHTWGSISLGVLLAMSRHRFGEWYSRAGGAGAMVALLSATLVVGYLGWLRYLAIAPLAAVAIVALLARRGDPLPLGTLVGGMSYPFYLDHWLGLVLRRPLLRLHLGWWMASSIALVIALALSALHYTQIDRRILSRRSSWYTRRRGITACVAALSLVAVGVLGGLAFHAWPIR